LIVRAAPEDIPGLSTVGVDASALLFTAGVVTLAALASGLLPAIRSSNLEIIGGLQHSSRVGRGPDHLTRDTLVVVQTAAALVLLIGSALLFQSFRRLSTVDPGFDTEDIFTFQMAPNPREHGVTDGARLRNFTTILWTGCAMPGVSPLVCVYLPLDEGADNQRFATEYTSGRASAVDLLQVTCVGGDYFQTMGIQLKRQLLRTNANPTGAVGVIASAPRPSAGPVRPAGRAARPARQTWAGCSHRCG
jgi:hypothetical protein